MSSSFSDAVRAAFGKIISSYGFQIVEDHYDGANFGNAVVVLGSPDFRIRIVKDRGQIFGDAASASEPDNWYGLDRLFEVMGAPPIPPQPVTLEDLAGALEENFERVKSRLQPARFPATKIELERLGELARQAILKRFQRKPQ